MTHNTWPASLSPDVWTLISAVCMHHMEKLLICNQSCSSLKLTEAIRMLTFRNHRLCSLITVQNKSLACCESFEEIPSSDANKVRQSWINFVYFLTSMATNASGEGTETLSAGEKMLPSYILAWCKSVFIQQTGPTASQYCQMRNSWQNVLCSKINHTTSWQPAVIRQSLICIYSSCCQSSISIQDIENYSY